MGAEDTRELIHIVQALLIAGICGITTYLIIGDE
jgi:hypothetical protein